MGQRRVGRRTVETSNEEKLLFPADRICKGDLIDYYQAIAPRLLPWLRDRPLVVQRFPDGIDEDGFYQKDLSGQLPDWIETVRVKKVEGGHQRLAVCNEAAALVYLANLACVTLHPWLSRRDRLDHPDQLIVDLDPARDDFASVRHAARVCRDLFEELGLPCFLKTSGSKGVHLLVPLDRGEDFDAVRAFAREAMGLLAARHPDRLTVEQRKSKRKGRLYLDVGRNAYAQTAVAPYSLRALPKAPVATPIDWRELGQVRARSFHLKNLLRRLGQRDDPWKGLPRRARGLDGARRRLEALARDEC